jgi:hypothetical protein
MSCKILLSLLIIVATLPCLHGTGGEDVEKQTVLANRFSEFKRTSGFRGVYKSDERQTRIQQIVGNFNDITFSEGDSDTLIAQISEEILLRVKPVIQVQGDLVFAKLIRTHGLLRVLFQQIVNGYRVERGVYVRIDYFTGRRYFDLFDDTCEFDTTVEAVISREEALSIWRERMRRYNLGTPDESEPQADLAYYLLENGSGKEILLSWMISGSSSALLIEASSGKHRCYYGYVPRTRQTPRIWGLLV